MPDKVKHPNARLAEQNSSPAPQTKEKPGVITNDELTTQHAISGSQAPQGIWRPLQQHESRPPEREVEGARAVVAGRAGLDAWHHALADAESLTAEGSSVMPMGFGGRARVDDAAWYGDKLLHRAVAEVLLKNGVQGRDNLTRRHSALTSNANLASRLDCLLPEHMQRLLPSPGTCARQPHDCGTVVEACVAFVYKAGHRSALVQLAEYLYAADCADAALLFGGATDGGEGVAPMPETNPKGRLLQLDSKALFTQVGGPDSPLWTTTVTSNGATASAQGVGKKAADQLAAAKILTALGIRCQLAPSHLLALDARKAVAEAATERLAQRTTQPGCELAWMLVHFEEKDLKFTLQAGESALDWFVKEDDTHRIALAPVVFSRWVEEVLIWKAKLDTGHLTLIHVKPVGGLPPHVFVSPHPEASQRRAHKAACKQARACIVELVGAPPPLVSDTVA